MSTLRIGVIGMGNIGRFYADHLKSGKIERCELTAVCSTTPEKLSGYSPVKVFGNAIELMESNFVDAVLIATPHFHHTTLGIAAIKRGLHLLVEKPISAHKADAQKLISAWKKAGPLRPVFATMLQFRIEPKYRKIRDILLSGELGQLVRVNWIVTDWFRTESYYSSGNWRATWAGEGGGVLLNQATHNLDIICWLFGLPDKVMGFCGLGRYHDIEVEDDVTAYMEFAGGATGVFITSTGESPGTNRLEITGTMGKIILEKDKLLFHRNAVSMTEFSRKAESGFARPEVTITEIPFANAQEPALAMIRNFISAVLDGTPLVAPGEEGLPSVELANMMALSSIHEKAIHAPLNARIYKEELEKRIKKSSRKTKKTKARVEDITQSWVR